MGGHEVVEFTQPFQQSTLIADVSWAMGMTYDPVGDRVITATLGGEGFLYSFALDNDQWSVIASLNNADLTAIAYSPTHDRIYGLGAWGSDSFDLYEYNSNGALLSRRGMDAPIVAGFIDRSIQLIALDDYLAVIQYPDRDGFPQPTIYAVDPVTAQAFSVVVPEPTTFTVASLGILLLGATHRANRGRNRTHPQPPGVETSRVS